MDRPNYHVFVEEVKIYIEDYEETLKKSGYILIIDRCINQKIIFINKIMIKLSLKKRVV